MNKINLTIILLLISFSNILYSQERESKTYLSIGYFFIPNGTHFTNITFGKIKARHQYGAVATYTIVSLRHDHNYTLGCGLNYVFRLSKKSHRVEFSYCASPQFIYRQRSYAIDWHSTKLNKPSKIYGIALFQTIGLKYNFAHHIAISLKPYLGPYFRFGRDLKTNKDINQPVGSDKQEYVQDIIIMIDPKIELTYIF